jgi:hypothetical protein
LTEIFDEEASLNHSRDRHLSDLVAVRLSRRTLLAGSLAGVAGFMTSTVSAPRAHALAPGGQGRSTAAAADLLGFDAIPLGYGDEVVVAPGYTARPFLPWARRSPAATRRSSLARTPLTSRRSRWA